MGTILVDIPVSVHVDPLMVAKNASNPSHAGNSRLRSPKRTRRASQGMCIWQTGHQILDNRLPYGFLPISCTSQEILRVLVSLCPPGGRVRCVEPQKGDDPFSRPYQRRVITGILLRHVLTYYHTL